MKLLVALLVLHGAAAGAETLDGAVADVQKRFAAAIKCGPGDRDLQRAWCAVTRPSKDAPKLTAAPVTYFGLTVVLHPGHDVENAFPKEPSPWATPPRPD